METLVDMPIAVVNICLLAVILSFTTPVVRSQDVPPSHPAERRLLELAMRDTTTHVVCYLPHGYFFGLNDRQFGFFTLVKAGRNTFLLREATGEVYKAVNVQGSPRLIRIDSTNHTGDNFRMIALERKDTLYSIGGYGFWQVRDHVSRFRPDKGDWAFIPVQNPYPIIHWLHHYDAREDALYVLCGNYKEATRNNPNTLKDRILKFNFRDHAWETLGRLDPSNIRLSGNWFGNEETGFAHTPFGLIDMPGDPCLIDFPENAVYPMRKVAFDTLRGLLNVHQTHYEPGYSLTIFLNDSLHFISMSGGSVRHGAMPLSRRDFEAKASASIFTPIREQGWRVTIVLLSIIGMSGILLLAVPRTRRHLKRIVHRTTEGKIEETGDKGREPLPSSGESPREIEHTNDMSRFLDSLPPAERELLKRLFILSLQGRMMDTEACNRVLGVSKKDETIRKTRRSQAIITLNEAYSVSLRREGELVVRVRNPDDKRSYLYSLSEAGLQLLKAGMPSN